jgi:hypothetical protein
VIRGRPNASDPGRGPLPETIGRWKGIFVDSHRVALSYSVGGSDVLEYPNHLNADGETVLTRTFDVGNSDRRLSLTAAEIRGARIDRSEADLLVMTQVETAPDTSAYVFDRLPRSMPNPSRRNVRVADVDFFDDGRVQRWTSGRRQIVGLLHSPSYFHSHSSR